MITSFADVSNAVRPDCNYTVVANDTLDTIAAALHLYINPIGGAIMSPRELLEAVNPFVRGALEPGMVLRLPERAVCRGGASNAEAWVTCMWMLTLLVDFPCSLHDVDKYWPTLIPRCGNELGGPLSMVVHYLASKDPSDYGL